MTGPCVGCGPHTAASVELIPGRVRLCWACWARGYDLARPDWRSQLGATVRVRSSSARLGFH